MCNYLLLVIMLYNVLTEILLQVTCHNMYTVQQDVVIMSQAEKILIREYLILSHVCIKAQFYWTLNVSYFGELFNVSSSPNNT